MGNPGPKNKERGRWGRVEECSPLKIDGVFGTGTHVAHCVAETCLV